MVVSVFSCPIYNTHKQHFHPYGHFLQYGQPIQVYTFTLIQISDFTPHDIFSNVYTELSVSVHIYAHITCTFTLKQLWTSRRMSKSTRNYSCLFVPVDFMCPKFLTASPISPLQRKSSITAYSF